MFLSSKNISIPSIISMADVSVPITIAENPDLPDIEITSISRVGKTFKAYFTNSGEADLENNVDLIWWVDGEDV
ncbi:MAG: hypothetical protein R6U40_11295, partial [Desulfobacterales bacterium]